MQSIAVVKHSDVIQYILMSFMVRLLISPLSVCSVGTLHCFRLATPE